LAQALAAARSRIVLVALLLAVAGAAWLWTAHTMAGMDAAPSTDVGALGWFVAAWVVMMAAMMLPSLSPTVALYATMNRQRGLFRPLMFCGGYLLVWGAAGLLAYGLVELGRDVIGAGIGWNNGGHWLAAAILVFAALYELTPLKHVCLGRCRSPLGFLLGAWRGGRWGAIEMGCRHAAWCLGCCWALMAALFALGVMSLTWMVVVAVLITLEKTVPWRRAATPLTVVTLLALAVWMIAAPDGVPGVVTPGHQAMGAIGAMGAGR
jgi:predicted metal-binding membrane protein